MNFGKSIYEKVPVFQTKNFEIRFISSNDIQDLLKVYSDEKSQPLFNSDNCHGDNFCYDTEEKMLNAMDFWFSSYEKGWFVRYSIVEKSSGTVIGTAELFTRFKNDYFNNCVILRLDLGSAYEQCEILVEIINFFVAHAKEYYEGTFIATKAIESAVNRRQALDKVGFSISNNVLVGDDGTEYDCYYERKF